MEKTRGDADPEILDGDDPEVYEVRIPDDFVAELDVEAVAAEESGIGGLIDPDLRNG